MVVSCNSSEEHTTDGEFILGVDTSTSEGDGESDSEDVSDGGESAASDNICDMTDKKKRPAAARERNQLTLRRGGCTSCN